MEDGELGHKAGLPGVTWLELLLVSVLGLVIYWCVSRDKEETLPLADGWWGPGSKPSARADGSIRPSKVERTDALIHDLHQRIDGFRASPPLEGSRFHYGFNANYLKRVVSYWRNEFDWRKQVEILNQYPHFKTKIEGQKAPGKSVCNPEKCHILPRQLRFISNSLDSQLLRVKFSLDDLLTNIMIYWTTGTIVSSQCFCKENMGQVSWSTGTRDKGFVPTGYSAFPCEILQPRKVGKGQVPKLICYSYVECGAHFAAFEEPKLLAQDFCKFPVPGREAGMSSGINHSLSSIPDSSPVSPVGKQPPAAKTQGKFNHDFTLLVPSCPLTPST
ncbi:epoxide hydrolase 1-like [Psammomys obesus]|uniref:epoxide hydrolase 1-like n=1 Tax=Psammomys obesus TaxID=48139 RepID=UPI0024533869|nr:epoxide hydrolase 1-like [Psammomys obesus]